MKKLHEIVREVRDELISQSNAEAKSSAQRFFKESINLYGVKAQIVGKIAKTHFKSVQTFSKSEVLDTCELLWQSGVFEESLVACHWSHAILKHCVPSDFVRFEHWINNYISNWASCDTFCNHTVGDFVIMHPEFVQKLKEFTSSKNLWMRRAAAVSLIIPARKGLFLSETFEIALLLLTDKEDLVQKGYGWMLKVASQKHPTEVFEFIMKNKTNMPRTALRYAIEKLPNDMKELAMAK